MSHATDANTRTQILDAAQDLVQRLGANAMSYHDISQTVGIRKASIHYHFPTKEQLLAELLERFSRHYYSLLDEILQSSADAPTKLRRAIELEESLFVGEEMGKACLCGMLSAEQATHDSDTVANIRQFFEQSEKRFEQIIAQGIKEKSFRFAGDARAAAQLIVALSQGALFVARVHGGVKKFRAISRQLYKLLGVDGT